MYRCNIMIAATLLFSLDRGRKQINDGDFVVVFAWWLRSQDIIVAIDTTWCVCGQTHAPGYRSKCPITTVLFPPFL